MAGIYNEKGCAIVTTNSVQNIKHIHHRQPLLLNDSNLSNWLNKRDLIKDDYCDEINYYQVGKLVNLPLNNNIKCIERI